MNNWYNIATAKSGETIKNDYDGETWTKLSPDDPVGIVVESSISTNDSKIESNGAVKVTSEYDGDEYYILALSGGLNGERRDNKWENYLKDISNILSALGHSWIINLSNDCCDDIWYLTVGLRIKK